MGDDESSDDASGLSGRFSLPPVTLPAVTIPDRLRFWLPRLPERLSHSRRVRIHVRDVLLGLFIGLVLSGLL